MSFLGLSTVIKENDTAILYLGVNSMHAIDVCPTITNKKGNTVENVFQTNFGALKVKDLIGATYGSKIKLSKGWGYILQPTPELWTQTLPHRTQIIYTPDISMILFQLEIKPGSIVIESGTGSGSLSHYIIRALKPYGHLHTFDFHQPRTEQAREEFQKHGIASFVTTYYRDVCQNGFTDELNGKVDAVFLDLPAPQLAVPHARTTFKATGGRFCSFSPCIEQTQRCCEVLETEGFTEIQSMEILQMEDIIKIKHIPIIDLSFLREKKEDKLEDKGKKNQKPQRETKKYLTSSAPQTLSGHTGFLTVASFQPAFA